MKPTIKTCSFSSLMVYESCAYHAKLARLDKVPDLQPKNHADRGTAIHAEAEHYVDGTAALTHNLRHFADDLAALAHQYSSGRVIQEEEWAFDTDWNITDWKSGWLRLKCDAVCFIDDTHLAVIDFKTGKRFGNEIKHAEQLQLYAVCALLRYPDVQTVTTELWYFDQNDKADFVMKRSQLPRFLKMFDRRLHAMTTDTQFKPNPNKYSCQYCPYGPDKQGDCKFGVSKDALTSVAKPLVFSKKPSATDSMFKGEL